MSELEYPTRDYNPGALERCVSRAGVLLLNGITQSILCVDPGSE
jgi:hypothetical protein